MIRETRAFTQLFQISFEVATTFIYQSESCLVSVSKSSLFVDLVSLLFVMISNQVFQFLYPIRRVSLIHRRKEIVGIFFLFTSCSNQSLIILPCCGSSSQIDNGCQQKNSSFTFVQAYLNFYSSFLVLVIQTFQIRITYFGGIISVVLSVFVYVLRSRRDVLTQICLYSNCFQFWQPPYIFNRSLLF